MKNILIKLTKAPLNALFDITDQEGTLLEEGVDSHALIQGKAYSVKDSISVVTLCTGRRCKSFPVKQMSTPEIASLTFTPDLTSSLWSHLTVPSLFNSFYGHAHSYILEYPFSYQFQDQIVQSIKDHTKSYLYTPLKQDVTAYFNKAVLYNDFQSSGLLELTPKTKGNMQRQLSFPVFKPSSKEVPYTRSDSFYNYNMFFNVASSHPHFLPSCTSLSLDKEVNSQTMDYSPRSFLKQPLRAKDLRIRHILDNRTDLHLISQLLFLNNQPSYK